MSTHDIVTGSITFLLLLPIAFAQTSANPPSDREKADLRGNVQSVVTETAVHLSGRTYTSTETVEFIADGRLLQRATKSDQGSEWILTNTYDARGLLLETVNGNSDIPIAERFHTRYNYDKNGHLIDARSGSSNDVFARVDDQGSSGTSSLSQIYRIAKT